jgi:4-alpha-glucanotransferase
MPLGIYQDLAMSDDPYGSDRWANPEFYIEKVQIGAPPDDFSPNGQNWGFPAPDLERMREKGYAYFIQEIKNNCRFSGCLRMDHVMRLFHYFWIMEGKEPSEGAYVAARHEELLGILALESVRNKVLMIGEDLGTVQPYVREELDRYGVFSYRLLYFEKHEEGRFKSPSEYPPYSLATVTTHDLPTLCGFWQGMDLLERNILGLFPDEVSYSNALRTRQEDKQRLLDAFFEEGLMPPYASRNAKDYLELSGELHNAAVGYLARSRAKLMQLNQEDLFKDLRQQNIPGNTRERKNWAARMLFRTDDLHHNAQVGRFAGMYRNWIIHSNRTPEK